MDKKKAIICTILFSIVVCSIFLISVFIELEFINKSLFHIFCPFIAGDWIGKQILKFYEWLRYK